MLPSRSRPADGRRGRCYSFITYSYVYVCMYIYIYICMHIYIYYLGGLYVYFCLGGLYVRFYSGGSYVCFYVCVYFPTPKVGVLVFT